MRLTALASVLVLSLVAAGAAPSGGGPPVQPPSALADVDGDGVSDDLQAELARARPGDRFDVVATFRDQPAAASARASVREDVYREFRVIPAFAATITKGQVLALAQHPRLVRIDADFEVATTNNAANADFGTAAARTAFEVDGSGVEVCVVDTGVDPNHEQFSTKLPIPFFDAINGRTVAYDDHGHGTHVAGTAVGDGTGGSSAPTYAGVAPGASLSAAKVLSSAGSGTASQVIAGIDWCAGRPSVHVISMSLGSAAASDGKDSISQAVDAAVTNKGKVVVVAAGNSGDAEQTVGSPGAAAHALTVAAAAEWSADPGSANHSRGIHLAPWSSRGPTLDGRMKPDVTAPGMTITSAQAGTTAGYATFSGTSMATPFVSGTVALALEADSTLTPAEVRALVEGTAHARGSHGDGTKNVDWGAGLLDGYAVVATAAGGDGATAFPASTTLKNQSVANNGTWSYEFVLEEDDLGVPIAATIIIDGELSCALWFWGLCWAWEWSPDLDARLVDPSGTVIATSTCPFGCHSNSIGRQETIQVMPTTAGSYRLEVYPYDGSPNDGKGGNFTVDLSHGPVGATSEPDPDPPADPEPDPPADPDPATASFTASCEDLTCSFTDTSTGTVTAWHWDFGEASTSTDQHPSHTYVDAGTYTVTLTVNPGTDNEDTYSQQVTVTAPPEVATDVRVADIGYGFAGGQNRHLIVTVAIEDNLGSPVEGASVTVSIESNTGRVATGTGTTRSDGTVAFRWNNAPGSCWTTTVTAIQANGLDFDPNADGNTHTGCR